MAKHQSLVAARTLEEALRDPAATTELELDAEDLARPLPVEISTLTHLKKLRVTGLVNGTQSFPSPLLELPIEDIELRNFRVYEIFPIKTLRHLTLVSHFIQDDMLPLCRNLVSLETLDIGGYHPKQTLVIPPQVSRLKNLRSLRLASCRLKELPDNLAELERLTEIVLRDQKLKEFPSVLTRMKTLERLEISSSLREAIFPESMAEMTALKHLNLQHSFGPPLLSDEDMEVMFEETMDGEGKLGVPLPKLIGSLQGLESLDVGLSHINDIKCLASLKTLKRLSLTHNLFRSIEPLRSLVTLEELDLSYCRKIRDLAPLAELVHLQTLSLAHLYGHVDLSVLAPLENLKSIDVSSVRFDDLRPLLSQPALQTVIAGDDVMRSWSRREEARALPSVEDINRGLESTDLTFAETNLNTFATWVALHSSSEGNAAFAFSNVNRRKHDAEVCVPIESVSRALDHFGRDLSSATLVAVVGALFRSTYDNFEPAVAAIEVLIARKDVAAQSEVVAIFEKACEFYDTGHRFYSDTVHDQLLERLFPAFESEPLLRLLSWCSEPYLSQEGGMDGMDLLFSKAFQRATDPRIASELFAVFKKHVAECEPQYLHEYGLLEDLVAALPETTRALVDLKVTLLEKNPS